MSLMRRGLQANPERSPPKRTDLTKEGKRKMQLSTTTMYVHTFFKQENQNWLFQLMGHYASKVPKQSLNFEVLFITVKSASLKNERFIKAKTASMSFNPRNPRVIHMY